MPIDVRRAEAAEIPVLIELMREFFAESAYTLDSAWAARSFEALLSAPSHGAAWLARSEGIPAGYVVLTQRFSMEFGGLDGVIDDLFVRPEFRRAGIGRSLLGALIAESRRRGILALQVEVGRENLPATALYQSFGLRDKGRLALSMELPPPSPG